MCNRPQSELKSLINKNQKMYLCKLCFNVEMSLEDFLKYTDKNYEKKINVCEICKKNTKKLSLIACQMKDNPQNKWNMYLCRKCFNKQMQLIDFLKESDKEQSATQTKKEKNEKNREQKQ